MVPISYSKVFGPFALYPCRFNWTVYSLRNRLLYSLVLLVLLHKEEKRSNTTREYFRPGVERNVHFTQFSYRGNITVIFLLQQNHFFQLRIFHQDKQMKVVDSSKKLTVYFGVD